MSGLEGKGKQVLTNALLVLMGFFVAFVALEVVLRFLPVTDAQKRLAVNAEDPVLRYRPKRTFTWSKGWNFRQVNQITINNFGFVNDQDYDTTSTTPLLAVVGDSYVEAFMVPFEETLTGRLAAHFGPRARVYSFAVSGAPLSQYLFYSDYVRRTFKPDALVIVVAGNDFDESLARYSTRRGYHLFTPDARGELVLTRVDFAPSPLKKFFRTFALARYIVGNLQIQGVVAQRRQNDASVSEAQRYVGNTLAEADTARVLDSKRAVDAFLEQLPARSGLPPSRIGFVVDGMRPHLYEDAQLAAAQGSFFDVMRRAFIAEARARDYHVIDMQTIFEGQHRIDGSRFEFSYDNHWNARGHEVVSGSVLESELLRRWVDSER